MTDSQIEDELVILLSENIDQHFEQFVEYFNSILFRHAKNYSTSHEDAEDIVDETFIRVYYALKSYPPERIRSLRIRAWLLTILRNISLNYYTRLKKQEKFTISIDSLDLSEENLLPRLNSDREKIQSRTTEDEYLIRETLQETFKEIEKYINTHAKPERNRIILYMALLENYKVEEIARQLGVSGPVVHYVIRTAQSYLREKINK